MSQFSKWKTIGYAAALFVTGGISGGALGVYEAKSHLFVPQREQEIALRIRNRLQTRLGLTPDQMARITPIIDTAAADLRSIHRESAQRANKVFEDTYAQVSAILTPDQRVELEKMQKERREIMQAHWQEGRRHPGADDADRDGSPHDRPEAGASPSQ